MVTPGHYSDTGQLQSLWTPGHSSALDTGQLLIPFSFEHCSALDTAQALDTGLLQSLVFSGHWSSLDTGLLWTLVSCSPLVLLTRPVPPARPLPPSTHSHTHTPAQDRVVRPGHRGLCSGAVEMLDPGPDLDLSEARVKRRERGSKWSVL
ncbi:hypothetical protein WMY93_000024 [Mugilogobius chulae]|uniref:Uncharacterized protein n=1 Tax=Mugilogobius chulae TaxID=88201 RepID=A0AAW0PXQ2_9GOBI